MADQGVLNWLSDEFASRIAVSFEAAVGERPSVAPEILTDAPSQKDLCLRQSLFGLNSSLWLAAAESDWRDLAKLAIRDSRAEDINELKSAFQEILGRALAGVSQSISARIGKEVSLDRMEQAPAPETRISWIALHLVFSSAIATIFTGFESELLDALAPPAISSKSTTNSTHSKTFDLLLDVELPVSVSFGRAQIPLKDVLKLTTGSIVELNRTIAEPVEIVVNNCVIARGEVVVVDGNFGVRIEQVISRADRLRTLN